jgi:hypothetical protein
LGSGTKCPWLIDRDAFDAGLCDARRLYPDLCVKQQCKVLKVRPRSAPASGRSRPRSWPPARSRRPSATGWKVSDKEFEAWRANQPARATQVELDLDEENPPAGVPMSAATRGDEGLVGAGFRAMSNHLPVPRPDFARYGVLPTVQA